MGVATVAVEVASVRVVAAVVVVACRPVLGIAAVEIVTVAGMVEIVTVAGMVGVTEAVVAVVAVDGWCSNW